MSDVTETYRTMIVEGVYPHTIKLIVTAHRNDLNAHLGGGDYHEKLQAIDDLEEYMIELDKLIKQDEIACL